ncbi:hypothetical protein B5S31_g5084 [[Candida] boidinii]|nr:hypothetical protein B5S31_g5084 [[Candida] boidinii]
MIRNFGNNFGLLINRRIGKVFFQKRSLSTASEFLKIQTQNSIKENQVSVPLPNESIEGFNSRYELQIVKSVKENLQKSLVSTYKTESSAITTKTETTTTTTSNNRFKRFRKISLWSPFKYRKVQGSKNILKFTSPKFEDINTCDKIENYLLLSSLSKFQPNDEKIIKNFINSIVFKSPPPPPQQQQQQQKLNSDFQINNKIFNLPPIFNNIKTINHFLLFFITRKDLDSALTIYYKSEIMDKNSKLKPGNSTHSKYNSDQKRMRSDTINLLLKLNSIVNLSNLNFNNLKFTEKLINDIIEINSFKITFETFLLIYLNLQKNKSKINYLNWLRENNIDLNLITDSNNSNFKDLCILKDKSLLKELETTENLQILKWLK